MNYKETIDYLYKSAPMFQKIGGKAYKEGLYNTHALDEFFDHPHTQYKTIHIAGTNGKGSCSHTLASILQQSGYKVGLFTSPHMLDFRERIRINGVPVSEDFIVDFVKNYRHFFEPLSPSFFELTTAMAFYFFKQEKVDVAVIEVGLGGRLDCTNIIQPDLSIITNIGLDHTQFLGDTLAKIAHEKAGIIKKDTPVIIGESLSDTEPVFKEKAKKENAPILFADKTPYVTLEGTELAEEGGWIYDCEYPKQLYGELAGIYQIKNTNTILHALEELNKIGYSISEQDIRKGFATVSKTTGLQGRWQKVASNPTIICDSGHNVEGITEVVKQLQNTPHHQLHIIIGMVNDKDITGVLQLLPKNAIYYFTKPQIERGLNENELKLKGNSIALKGEAYPSVEIALNKARMDSKENDLIFVGGSSFMVADLLALIQSNTKDFIL
ncbi:MAG: bifunctional folylpolyglutamate synthase/dihydrofolate synthase [Bacteroidales bacterium]|nr:bifunctional folylpolyglutamate synthase/dihydrofolate synthase [Bacteroidales bacterium]